MLDLVPQGAQDAFEFHWLKGIAPGSAPETGRRLQGDSDFAARDLRGIKRVVTRSSDTSV